jgi:hypothetical protein
MASGATRSASSSFPKEGGHPVIDCRPLLVDQSDLPTGAALEMQTEKREVRAPVLAAPTNDSLEPTSRAAISFELDLWLLCCFDHRPM